MSAAGLRRLSPRRGETTDPLDASAVELARWIRDRRVSSEEVVGAHMARIDRVDPKLGAVVHRRFEEARREAKDADRRVARGEELGPLHGVPCTIKDFFAVRGIPQTGGLVARSRAVASEDAVLVSRLRRAGAIVLGTTNVPEGGLWMETHNALFGRTNNPWDLGRTPGGSSGGEGAIVAAGGSPFGLGSDVGGSVRIPAAFCGVAGHKPTGRMLPNTGQFPPTKGELSAYLCAGPLARRTEDLMPLLRVMAGPDAGDSASRAFELGDPERVRPEELVVYPIEAPGRIGVRESVRRGVRDATGALVAAGARVGEAKLPRLAKAFEIWAAMLSEVAELTYDEILTDGQERDQVPVLAELFKIALGRSAHTFPAIAVAGLERVLKRFEGPRATLVAEGRALGAELELLLGDRGVLVYPVYSRPAPRHMDALRTPFDAACTAIFNVLELPSTVVPVGFEARGLPIAVQIVGARGRDHLTIAAASFVEAELGGWERATPAGVS